MKNECQKFQGGPGPPWPPPKSAPGHSSMLLFLLLPFGAILFLALNMRAIIGNFYFYANRVGGDSILIGLSIATTIFFQILPFLYSVERTERNIEKIIGYLWDCHIQFLCYIDLNFWKFMVSCTIIITYPTVACMEGEYKASQGVDDKCIYSLS